MIADPLGPDERAAMEARDWRPPLGDARYMCLRYEATVRAVEDRLAEVTAERDAWRALGREQMAECAVWLDEGCSFCGRIADLLGEEPTDA